LEETYNINHRKELFMKRAVYSCSDIWSYLIGGEVPDPERCQIAISKAIYRGTRCGAWIRFNADGIKLGSIVEGSDAETETHTLLYPFDYEEIWSALEAIEDEAEILWHEANDLQEEMPCLTRCIS